MNTKALKKSADANKKLSFLSLWSANEVVGNRETIRPDHSYALFCLVPEGYVLFEERTHAMSR